MADMTIDRYGMRAGTVFRNRYSDQEGNLTYDFTANASAYDGVVLFNENPEYTFIVIRNYLNQ